MAIFRPKPWVNPLVKCQFFDFLNFLLLKPRKEFFRSTISYSIFSWSISPKRKKLEKWPFLDQNHGLTPLRKYQFFDFWTSCFYSLERRFFPVQYSKGYFPGLYCLKENNWKNGLFWTKTFGKMSIFRLFELLVFIAQKGVFSF